jgi:adenylate cyclase
MFPRFGIRTRLLFAFVGISLFSVLAAAAALYSFVMVGNIIIQVSDIESPAAIQSLELSRQAQKMASAASQLITVGTDNERAQVWAMFLDEGEHLNQVMSELRAKRANQTLAVNLVEWSVNELRKNLEKLNRLAATRLEYEGNLQKLLSMYRESYSNTQQLLTTALSRLEYQIEIARATGGDTGSASNGQPSANSRLGKLIAVRASLQESVKHVSTINNIVLSAQLARPSDKVRTTWAGQRDSWRVEAQVALSVYRSIIETLDPKLAKELNVEFGKIRETIDGTINLFSEIESRSAVIEKARVLLLDNSTTVSELTGATDQLVDLSKKNISSSFSEATSAQKMITMALMIIVALSLICSVLIVWLYVGRNVIARITELSECMEFVAGGDLMVDLPSVKTDDEIGRMVRALTVFRDTAVEIEETNLRDLALTRQRLMDAIESISEGFCYYDADDRLVVANNRYRSLMYPGAESTVTEGMKFEEVIRKAAERGYIRDAAGNINDWVAQRLAQHREPDQPHIQQRGNGQWIMVSERKTGDRGTVGIYADITELKEREDELARKSESMENLSNQIAKYVSPQIYDSIFTGKREVKVASHRRKLTVFFSDIAGFTETADQLESEDLTALLNHYLTEMSDIALDYGATIDKYVGDAIVIFFGDPETRGTKEDALACVKMAIAMRQRMTQLQGIWRDSGISRPLQCRIGINTGFCTVGNFGSEARMDYTIIGSGVNLASRLESAATPNEILVSYETYALVKDDVHCKSAGTVELKGISHPVETYQVVDLYENLTHRHQVIQEEFPNFNLQIDLDRLSRDERGRVVVALQSALDKVGDAERSAKETATIS